MANEHNLGCSKRAGALLFKRTDIDEYINSDYFKNKTMEGVTLIQTNQYNNLMSKIEDLHHVVMNMSLDLEDINPNG
jgi:hypothetical protein